MKINEANFRQVHNLPAVIRQLWTEEFDRANEKMPENSTKFMRFPDRQLELKEDTVTIGVLGMAYFDDDFYLLLHSETEEGQSAIDKIGSVMVSKEIENGLPFSYRPVFICGEVEEKYSRTKHIIQRMSQPTAGVGAFIMRKDEEGKVSILLGRRVKGPYEYLNRLSNFGGAADLGEDIASALVRELKEEVNLDVDVNSVNQPVSFDETIYKWKWAEEAVEAAKFYHAYSHTFAFMIESKELLEQIQCNEPEKTRSFGWYSIDWVLNNLDDCTPLLRSSLDGFHVNHPRIVTI